MKKYAYATGIFFLLLCMTGLGYTAENATMTASPVPQLIQLVGTTDASLAATRYPVFSAYTSDNPTCGDYLKTAFVEGQVTQNCPTEGLSCATNGLSLAPLWYKSKYSGTSNAAPLAGQPEYTLIPGLKTTVTIPEKYRTTAKVLFTWTVRVEARRPDAFILWPHLCSYWHGTSEQLFEKGDVYSQLYVNGQAMGNKASMTVPAAGENSSYQPSDPTHTGSYLLTPEDFDGKFPEEFTVEVRWYNDTSMILTSPADMRNLIGTMIPIDTN